MKIARRAYGLMVEALSLSVWKKFAEECWRNALIGMGKEIRKSCWEPVSALKLVDRPNGWMIIADRRFDMHLTMPSSGVAHITSNKPKRVWRRLPSISIHNVWWLGPDLLLKLFEGCEREKISFFLMEAKMYLEYSERIVRDAISASLAKVERNLQIEKLVSPVG